MRQKTAQLKQPAEDVIRDIRLVILPPKIVSQVRLYRIGFGEDCHERRDTGALCA